MSGWWRANRRWLLVLPVALLVAVALSSGRLVRYWLPEQRYDAVTGTGSTVHYEETYVDAGGEKLREVTIELLAVAPADTIDPGDDLGGEVDVLGRLPEETRLWAVDLSYTADPDVVLNDCTVALVDDDGREHTSNVTERLFSVTSLLPFPAYGGCVPQEAPGPSFVLGLGIDEEYAGQPRPASFEVRTYVLMPDDAVPETLRVWWGRGLPRFAQLDLG